MTHTYKFANSEHTVVEREDGVTFPWAPGLTPADQGQMLSGFVGEDYRTDGHPEPAPFHQVRSMEFRHGEDDKPPAKKRGAKAPKFDPVGFMSGPLFPEPKKARGKK